MKNNINKTHKKSDSPFTILETDDNKFLISLGNQIVSEITFDTLEQAEAYIYEKPWELILNSAMYLIHYNIQIIQNSIEKQQENISKTEN